MKRRVCCLLLGICILMLPVQQVYAAPEGPAAHDHEHEHPKPHECKHEHPKPHEEKKGPLAEKPVPPHEHEHEKPVPPHEKKPEHPLLPHEHVHEHAHEHPTPTTTPVPTATPKPTATPAPTEAPKPTVTPVPTETPTYSVEGSELVKFALQFVGNPYKYGGSSLTNGADCSGFVQAVYAHFGYSLDRTSGAQAASTEFAQIEVKESELLPGDLIFYANSRGSVYHVAIYIGDGKIVHASNARKEIVISAYNGIKPYKARRIIT